jgi:16S rRNA (cytidine1402-2'-O)-methyltransferase
MSACLYIVPTPIGNLKDITLRALEVLKEVDYILAEDTRQTRKLLSHYQISTKLIAFHQHNEHKNLDNIISKLSGGDKVALVSDAGTPGISDPGFLLSRACIQNNIQMIALPGATAFVPALLLSGFPCDRFIFEGFLPLKKGRQKRLISLAEEPRTIIFYESPHRIEKALVQMAEFFGLDRQVAVCREITKIYEETLHGTFEEVIHKIKIKPIKGEIVIIVHGKE